MAAPAQYSTSRNAAYDTFDVEQHYAPLEFSPGERISPPVGGSRRKPFMWASVVIILAIGSGWALLDDKANWSTWLSAETTAIFAAIDRKVSGSAAPAAEQIPPSTPAAIAEVQPLVSREIVDAPQPATTEPDVTIAAPLPPPVVDRAAPHQVRAEAVGLHPGLSRVLLTRLSTTDFRNAGIAIKTALTETPDDAVFVWPRQRKPELALFQVSFVTGVSPECRRYVVKVTKDGWLTTALPMEKCGAQTNRPRRD